MPTPWTYERAGLDLEKYAATMAGIQPLLARTWDANRVVPPPFPPRKGGKGTAGFASLFDINPDGRYKHPILVTCTDGVGSKLKLAAQAKRFDTVGIDLVAMSVNDLICTGGEPLVFLDYVAMHADDTELTRQLVQGISDGCLEAGCSLVGGETAILPDIYAPGEFDLAGFAAGVVERDRVIDGRAVRPGDVLVGLPSSGVHSNGYSLVRKVVEAAGLTVSDTVPELGGTVGDVLLTPTRLYVSAVRAILAECGDAITGLANVTGGGLPDNVARVLPPDCHAVIDRPPQPAVFAWLQRLGQVTDSEMDRVFNRGTGFVVICRPAAADAVARHGGTVIGKVTPGEAGVTLR
jgi:phosphoribosylformylglycinamidine cyclo-ligase